MGHDGVLEDVGVHDGLEPELGLDLHLEVLRDLHRVVDLLLVVDHRLDQEQRDLALDHLQVDERLDDLVRDEVLVRRNERALRVQRLLDQLLFVLFLIIARFFQLQILVRRRRLHVRVILQH